MEQLQKQALPATEQQQQLGQDALDSTAKATEVILIWLNKLAKAILAHKATPAYQEHARKSGTQKNQSGLNETELKAKEEKKREQRQKYGRQPSRASGSDTGQARAQPSTASGSDTWQAPGQWQWHCDTWNSFSLWPAQWPAR